MNRNKRFVLISAFFSIALLILACGDNSSNDRKVVTEVNSIYELGACTDNNEGDTVYVKNPGDSYLCLKQNWYQIPNADSSKDLSSSSTKNSSNSGTLNSSASKEELLQFAELCKASGGSEKDGICVCSDEICDIGSVCNTVTKKCANEISSAETDCDESFKSTCSNSPTGIGIVKECTKGVLVNRSCNTVSCNEKGTDCGECLDNASTCTEDKNFKATVTRCENGKKVTESCGENSCDQRDGTCGECTNYGHTCINDDEGNGTIFECVAGESKKALTFCGSVSCRADKPICGECRDGDLKCDNDINNNAIMSRCVNGLWKKLINPYDPLDKENYKCPADCQIDAAADRKEYGCDISQCSSCDPCAGSDENMTSDYNPCYDAERCKAVLQEEDPDYPPFRDFYTTKKLNDTRTLKQVTGYDFTDHTASTIEARVHPFYIDLTAGTQHVSCNAAGTYYGKCHNSLQLCINKNYHQEGFMVACANGDLADDDNNGDGIACECEKTANNSIGCCYTRSTCFKNTVFATDRCNKPTTTTEGYGADDN